MNKNIPYEIQKEGNEGYIFVKEQDTRDALWAIFKEDGTQQTPFQYDRLTEFKFGYASARVPLEVIGEHRFVPKCTEIDKSDNVVIYGDEDSYSKKYDCLLDKDLNVLHQCYFSDIDPCSEDGYRIITDGVRKRGFFKDGEFNIPAFDFIFGTFTEDDKRVQFVNGLTKARYYFEADKEKFGSYITRNGYLNEKYEWVVEPKYHHLTEFKNGLAKFYQHVEGNPYDYLWGYVDLAGNEYLPTLKDQTILLRNQHGEVGPLKSIEDFYDIGDSFRYLFENGKYGFYDKKGHVFVEGLYDDASTIIWGDIGYVKKGEKWAFINKTGTEITDFLYDHVGFISPGYAQALIGETMYLIGSNGEIAKKKNGYFGYRKKLTHFQTGETRNSCGFYLQYHFNKNDKFDKNYWIGIDEFDKEIRGNEPGMNTQFPADWSYNFDVIEHHEPSDTYYFKTGNKYGVDTDGNKVVLADLKEKFPDVDNTDLLTDLKIIYQNKEVPALWQDLIRQGWAWETPREGHADCSFSRGIALTHSTLEDVQMCLEPMCEDPEKYLTEMLNTFYYIAQADGTGAAYYYFMCHPDQPIEENPIVFIGSEGECNLVASNLKELLQLLATDTEPMGEFEMEKEQTLSFYKDMDEQETTYLPDYVAWLSEHGIEGIVVEEEFPDQDPRAQKIVDRAVEKYFDRLYAFMEKIGFI
ncbi:WG repeat-containing protein [Isobaculum melis]|uniref:WG containing repeat-containing protein n=1 Tax=Isobaculum melis TaxID=142588 RepID=A0A1H9TUH9_9LACT|nr:WG repeat-containing protein [Isobaculum melis]SES00652.1 WG containing repeat-containing protein [Isobaculum melis]